MFTVVSLQRRSLNLMVLQNNLNFNTNNLPVNHLHSNQQLHPSNQTTALTGHIISRSVIYVFNYFLFSLYGHVHLHECSPFWVGIFITFNKENYHVYCLM